jgi:DNA-binding response OmpR family regulator
MIETLRALLIDDEPWFAEALRVALEADGFDCVAVTDMSAGLRYLDNNDVSVVVTDIMLPPGPDYSTIKSSETGFHLVRMVRQRWPDLPIVCLSVIGDQRKIEHLKQLRTRYLRKGETPLEKAIAVSKYPPAEPGALESEPLKAAAGR